MSTDLAPTDQFVVETPENIRFGYDVADIGSRFLAILIDSLIQGVIFVLILFATVLVGSQLAAIDLPRPVNDALAILLILVLFLVEFGYFLFLEIFMNGQTPGKRLFHLRVIRENGYPLSALDSIIRNLVRIIDFFPFAYGIGVVTMFSNKRAKRLGDYAAGTLVVKMRDEVRLAQILPTPTSGAPAPSSAPPRVVGVTVADIELAESYLHRRAQFSNQDALGLQIAQRLAAKMDLPAGAVPTTPAAATAFLRDTVNAYRAPRG